MAVIEKLIFDTRHIVLDPSKLMKLGWKCDIDLKEVLKRHAEWFLKYAKSQNVAEIFTEAYGQQLQDGAIKGSKIPGVHLRRLDLEGTTNR